jgi:dolichyl-diphosphooligosaccharide--protein glycosyltransferase
VGYGLRQKVGDLKFRLEVIFIPLIRYIPIIASVSEHQPTAWPSFFMDLHFLVFLFPAGVILCFRELRDEHVFVIIYALVASYFAGVMVRLMLTLTPIVCVAAAVALSSVLDTYIDPIEPDLSEGDNANAAKKDKSTATPASRASVAELLVDMVTPGKPAGKKSKPVRRGIVGFDTRIAVIMNALGMLIFFVVHCTWVTSTAYSSPSVVLASHMQDGLHLIDDFREAYYWLRQNTPKDAVVMSWWDYGYQIAGMADRPTLVDNNTWNNSKCFRPCITSRNETTLQLTSQRWVRPCRAQKKSHTLSYANMMSTMCWLFSAV